MPLETVTLTPAPPESSPVPLAAAPAASPADPLPWRQRIRWPRAAASLVGVVVVLYVTTTQCVIPTIMPTGSGPVNLRSALVRAPHEGWAEPSVDGVGVRVKAGQQIGTVKAVVADDALVQSLRTRRAELRATSTRLGGEKRAVAAKLATATAGLEAYQEAIIESLSSAVTEAKTQLEMARVEHQAASRNTERLVRLTAGGSVSDWEVTAVQARSDAAELSVTHRQAALNRTTTELAAARRGVFLGREGPFYLQLREQMAVRLAGIEVEALEVAHRLDAVEVELAAAQDRAARLAETPVVAPVDGPVLRRLAHRGPVPRFEPLFEIGDERDVCVEVVVHQQFLPRIGPGTPAVIKVTGGPVLSGRVRLVRGSGPTAEPSNATPVARRPDQVCVLVDADDPATLAGLASRHCEVLILPRDPGVFSAVVGWVFAPRL